MNHDYFMDQYGYLYRWEEVPEGKKSVVVANWQNDKGSAKEVSRLLNVLDAHADLLAALEALHAGIAKWRKTGEPPYGELHRAHDAATEAIAKARGQ